MADAVYTRKNQFRGINPLLNKHLFYPGQSVWPSFHSAYLNALCIHLNAVLPSRYVAHPEQSLQIMVGDAFQSRPIPDVSIFRGREESKFPESLSSAELLSTPTWEAIVEDETLERMIPAVVIRDNATKTQEHPLLGKPVTRIELLSPDNMPTSGGYLGYLHNRTLALRTDTALVELDYLHHLASPAEKMLDSPQYPNEAGAYPYTIAINKPLADHRIDVRVFGFHVDEAIPTIEIPLAEPEGVKADLDSTYMQTYHDGRWGSYVNYAEALEVKWLSTFSSHDRQNLVNRQLSVIDAAKNGTLEAH